MLALAFQNGWKGGEFNVVLFNIAHEDNDWVVAIGLMGFGIALLVNSNSSENKNI